MEILFVSHKYPPATGGMEKQSFELMKGMERYCTVHRIVPMEGESRFLFFLKLNKRIKDTLKAYPGIKTIHLNDGLLAAICSFHKGYENIPVFVTLHGLEVSFPSVFYRKYIFRRLSKYKGVIAVSDATALAAIDAGLESEKVKVVANGVDINVSDVQSDIENIVDSGNKKILMMLGRPVRRKGFSWFIKDVLPSVSHDFQVVIVGPFNKIPTLAERLIGALPKNIGHKIMLFLGYPSDEGEIREILKTNTNVTHLGLQPYSVIQALFRQSAVFIMPNIKVEGDMEGFGLVCLEASVNGALVLAADVDGIPSAIQHQKNGILVESGNPKAWKNILNELSTNPEDFEAKKAPFQEFTLSHYSWDKMVQGYWELMNKVQSMSKDLTGHPK